MNLEPHFPELLIQEVTQGQAIVCGNYPLKPIFVVLHGKVLIEKPHKVRPEPLSQLPVRDACLKMFKGVRSWFWQSMGRNRGSTGTHNASKQYLTPLEMYDGSLGDFTCAHAVTDSSIFELNSGDDAGVAALKQVLSARRSRLEQ
jgi:hypothetical protein